MTTNGQRLQSTNALFRTVIVTNASLAALHAVLDQLAAGNAQTAMDTGVDDEAPIGNLKLIAPPNVTFDGTNWVVFLFVTTA